jgi:DeoR/GlpR family transcriptional regulator of sugar metabolism
MLAVERKEYILNSLKKNKIAQVSDLSKEMGVTEETIRRDLEKLEKQSIIQRVHGGAYLKEGFGNETPLTVREKVFIKEKEKLARYCIEEINEKESVFIDCSSTALYLAKEIRLSQKKIIVVTNSISVAKELDLSSQVRLIMLGGERDLDRNACHGEVTVQMMQQYYVDKAFISGAGISLKAGLTDYTQEEAAVRQAAISHAKRTYFMADITKISRCAVNIYGNLEQLYALVVNTSITNKDEALEKKLNELNVRVIVA